MDLLDYEGSGYTPLEAGEISANDDKDGPNDREREQDLKMLKATDPEAYNLFVELLTLSFVEYEIERKVAKTFAKARSKLMGSSSMRTKLYRQNFYR